GPRGPEVAARQAREPVTQDRDRPGVEPEFGPDRVERVVGGFAARVAGGEDGEGGVAVGEPRQQADGGEHA
ncbi:hypothetical protein ADL26_20750, partial [Thermoactinomyces vulgaris]